MKPVQNFQNHPIRSPYPNGGAIEPAGVPVPAEAGAAVGSAASKDAYAPASPMPGPSVPEPPAAVSEPPAEARESDLPGRSLTIAGALALSLVPGLFGCATPAPDSLPKPPPMAVISVAALAPVLQASAFRTTQQVTAPVGDEQQQAMSRIATPTDQDDETTQEIRSRYDRHVQEVVGESRVFEQVLERVGREGDRLDEVVAQAGTSGEPISQDGFTITVEREGDCVRVEALSRGVTIESVREGDVHTVTIHEGRSETRMRETPNVVTITSDGVERTLHTQADPEHGFKAGDFEVKRETPRGRFATLARGVEIHHQADETIHGFAGDIRQSRREDFTVPDVHIEMGPKVTLDYRSRVESLNEVTGRSTVRTRHAAVFDDGHSTDHVAEVEGEH